MSANRPRTGAVAIKPKYRACGIPEHDGNPLIAALPPIRDDKGWLAQLLALPTVSNEQRDAPSHIRAYYISQIKTLFIPDSAAKAFARRMDILIRSGLVARNPRTPARAELLQKAYEQGQCGGSDRVVYSEDTPISSFSLFGVSGMGKSTATAAVLGAYPQYIIHDEYDLHQVVWLKVETPKDGSVRELGVNILRAFDRVLGTDHVGKVAPRTNGTAVLQKAGVLATTHCLGALVIDEIQNVSVKKSGGREELLNWCQELVNELRVPVVLLGTPKARSLFELQLRHARRAGTSGSAFWQPMALDVEFDTLLGQLWQRLVLRDAGALTDDMRSTVYRETQGVKAFMADMLLVSQLHALAQGDETITPELLKHVAQTEFAQVQRFLQALRSKEPKRLVKYEDMCDYDIEDLMERTRTSLAAAVTGGAQGAQSGNSMVEQAIRSVLSTLPLDEKSARELVLRVAASATPTSARALTSAAIQAFAESDRATEAA